MNKKAKLKNLLEVDAQIVNQNLSLSYLEGSSVTITGVTGLVGLNIASALIYYNERFAKNTIKINAISHREPQGDIFDILKNESVEISLCDLSNSTSINNLPSSDYIIHSAGYAQPGKFLKDKLKTIEINTTGNLRLFEKLNPEGTFLFISSSEIYSGSKNLRSSERDVGTTDPSHPRACYIEGKRLGETIVNIKRDNDIKAVSARLALAYGPGIKKDDERVLNQLISKGLNGEIKLLDAGEAVRAYCYISDVVIMLLNILMKSSLNVYNVGGKSVVTIKELAQLIGEELEVPVNFPLPKTAMKDAPEIVGLDLSRIEKEYGFQNYTDINEGIAKTIKWIKAINEI